MSRAGRMHASSDKSARCRRVLSVLRSHGWIDGLELESSAKVRAVGTVCSELRTRGHDIRCRYSRQGELPGSKVYEYRLVS